MQEKNPTQSQIQSIVENYFQQSGQNLTVDIKTSRQCGQLLLQHCNDTGKDAAFILIVIKGYEQAHYLAGIEGGFHFWKQLSSSLSSILPKDSRLAQLPFGFAIHLCGGNIAEKTQCLIDKTTVLLRQPLPLPDLHGDSTLHISVDYHIGYLVYPEDSGQYDNFDDITRCVSSAAWANSSAINLVTRYTPENFDILSRQAKIRQRLALAIKERALTFVYQPQYHLARNKVIGIEALIRWQDAELGEVSPSEFIPVAESCELILPLTELSIVMIVDYIKANQQQLPEELRFSINISKSVFNWNQFDLYEIFEKHMARQHNNCQKNVIDIEITESSYFDPWRSLKVTETLSRLAKLGIQIIIDDFGSGYGSLSLIASGTVNAIKFDRELTAKLAADSPETGFLDILCDATRHSSLKLVAEGVETEQQKIILMEKGINIIQGYLFSYPLNGPDLIDFLNRPIVNKMA